MLKKSGFVYIWYDRKQKRYYVGSHWGTLTDGYICSSRWMRKAYHRRPEDFKRRIIANINTTQKDLFVEEQRWLQMIKPEEIRIRYYNLILRTDHHWANNQDTTKTVSEKISRTLTGRKNGPHKEETKAKISAAHVGMKHTEKTKAKIAEIRSGTTISDDVRLKMSKTHKLRYENGTPQTETSKQKMSEYAKNRTPEHRAKISEKQSQDHCRRQDWYEGTETQSRDPEKDGRCSQGLLPES